MSLQINSGLNGLAVRVLDGGLSRTVAQHGARTINSRNVRNPAGLQSFVMAIKQLAAARVCGLSLEPFSHVTVVDMEARVATFAKCAAEMYLRPARCWHTSPWRFPPLLAACETRAFFAVHVHRTPSPGRDARCRPAHTAALDDPANSIRNVGVSHRTRWLRTNTYIRGPTLNFMSAITASKHGVDWVNSMLVTWDLGTASCDVRGSRAPISSWASADQLLWTSPERRIHVKIRMLTVVWAILHRNTGATVAERLACSLPNQGDPHVVIVPDDAVGRRVYSGVSRFPRPSFRCCSILTSITPIGSQNLLRLERASQKQSSGTHKTPYDRVKRCRERKINFKESERLNFASRTLHCLVLAVTDFPSAGHFSRCLSSIARNSATHSFINSNSTPDPEACRGIYSLGAAIWKVQRTPSRAERTRVQSSIGSFASTLRITYAQVLRSLVSRSTVNNSHELPRFAIIDVCFTANDVVI
ncbi:hypothetical protein PR048_003741 [Dryococelus australis]|uniref:Uncharacterized protein n=1 Tax=Dryococelus australis TaxID=614101 RepID=A0ABQ9INW0_9NEOP|nr:hypothetical protein PR048_003741 [Dryococelus australis]